MSSQLLRFFVSSKGMIASSALRVRARFWAVFSSGADVRFFAFFGKLRGAHQGVGLGVEGVEPELFGSPVGLVIISGGVGLADLGKSFGIFGKLPVGDLVNGPGMALGIAETFRQQGFVAVNLMPLRGD